MSCLLRARIRKLSVALRVDKVERKATTKLPLNVPVRWFVVIGVKARLCNRHFIMVRKKGGTLRENTVIKRAAA